MKELDPVKVFESMSSVEEAAPERLVRYPLVRPQASAEVVLNALPRLRERNAEAEVVENARPWLRPRKVEADVVENAFPWLLMRK